MYRKLMTAAAMAALYSLSAATESNAQGLGDIAAWNAAQDAYFYNWAWQQSQIVARQIPDNVSSGEIIAAMRPYSTDAIYGGMNAQWHQLQQRQSDAMNRFSRHIRDEGVFVNPITGDAYQLPSYPGGYYQSPAGWIYQGHHPTDINGNFYLQD